MFSHKFDVCRFFLKKKVFLHNSLCGEVLYFLKTTLLDPPAKIFPQKISFSMVYNMYSPFFDTHMTQIPWTKDTRWRP